MIFNEHIFKNNLFHTPIYFFSFLFSFFVYLASSPSPTEKDGALLAHMQMSAHARSFHDTTARHSDVVGAELAAKNQQLLDAKYFSMHDANSRQFPPPMQYMGMPHLSSWQLAAH